MDLSNIKSQMTNIAPELLESLSWNDILRFRLIEIIALWEGRLITNHLRDAYDIKRAQASKWINLYKTHVPNNLEYDTKLKGYRPTTTFQPVFTTGTLEEYLEFLHENQIIKTSFTKFGLQPANTHILKPVSRSVKPEIIKTIINAINHQESIEVDYVSLSSPNREGRIITPHTLVNNGSRWHVRGYCEKNKDYRDFVLSRFKNAEPEAKSEYTKEQDVLWNTAVTIKLAPEPRLTEAQKAILIDEYDMKDGFLEIETNGALVNYMVRLLRIENKLSPTAQQLELVNYQELEPYLLSAR